MTAVHGAATSTLTIATMVSTDNGIVAVRRFATTACEISGESYVENDSYGGRFLLTRGLTHVSSYL